MGDVPSANGPGITPGSSWDSTWPRPEDRTAGNTGQQVNARLILTPRPWPA